MKNQITVNTEIEEGSDDQSKYQIEMNLQNNQKFIDEMEQFLSQNINFDNKNLDDIEVDLSCPEEFLKSILDTPIPKMKQDLGKPPKPDIRITSDSPKKVQKRIELSRQNSGHKLSTFGTLKKSPTTSSLGTEEISQSEKQEEVKFVSHEASSGETSSFPKNSEKIPIVKESPLKIKKRILKKQNSSFSLHQLQESNPLTGEDLEVNRMSLQNLEHEKAPTFYMQPTGDSGSQYSIIPNQDFIQIQVQQEDMAMPVDENSFQENQIEIKLQSPIGVQINKSKSFEFEEVVIQKDYNEYESILIDLQQELQEIDQLKFPNYFFDHHFESGNDHEILQSKHEMGIQPAKTKISYTERVYPQIHREKQKKVVTTFLIEDLIPTFYETLSCSKNIIDVIPIIKQPWIFKKKHELKLHKNKTQRHSKFDKIGSFSRKAQSNLLDPISPIDLEFKEISLMPPSPSPRKQRRLSCGHNQYAHPPPILLEAPRKKDAEIFLVQPHFPSSDENSVTSSCEKEQKQSDAVSNCDSHLQAQELVNMVTPDMDELVLEMEETSEQEEPKNLILSQLVIIKAEEFETKQQQSRIDQVIKPHLTKVQGNLLQNIRKYKISNEITQFMGDETKYFTSIRKHFLQMKPLLINKILKVRQNRYHIMAAQKQILKAKKESENKFEFKNIYSSILKSGSGSPIKRVSTPKEQHDVTEFFKAFNIINQNVYGVKDLPEKKEETFTRSEGLNQFLFNSNLKKLYEQFFGEQKVQSKYLSIFFCKVLSKSKIFLNLKQNHIYFTIQNVLNKIQLDFYHGVISKIFDQYQYYNVRIYNSRSRIMDDKPVKFEVGLQNEIQNRVIGPIVTGLMFPQRGKVCQIKRLIFQDETNIVRFNVRAAHRDILLPSYRKMFAMVSKSTIKVRYENLYTECDTYSSLESFQNFIRFMQNKYMLELNKIFSVATEITGFPIEQLSQKKEIIVQKPKKCKGTKTLDLTKQLFLIQYNKTDSSEYLDNMLFDEPALWIQENEDRHKFMLALKFGYNQILSNHGLYFISEPVIFKHEEIVDIGALRRKQSVQTCCQKKADKKKMIEIEVRLQQIVLEEQKKNSNFKIHHDLYGNKIATPKNLNQPSEEAVGLISQPCKPYNPTKFNKGSPQQLIEKVKKGPEKKARSQKTLPVTFSFNMAEDESQQSETQSIIIQDSQTTSPIDSPVKMELEEESSPEPSLNMNKENCDDILGLIMEDSEEDKFSATEDQTFFMRYYYQSSTSFAKLNSANQLTEINETMRRKTSKIKQSHLKVSNSTRRDSVQLKKELLNEAEYYYIFSDGDHTETPKKKLQEELKLKKIEKFIVDINKDIKEDDLMQSKFEIYMGNLKKKEPPRKVITQDKIRKNTHSPIIFRPKKSGTTNWGNSLIFEEDISPDEYHIDLKPMVSGDDIYDRLSEKQLDSSPKNVQIVERSSPKIKEQQEMQKNRCEKLKKNLEKKLKLAETLKSRKLKFSGSVKQIQRVIQPKVESDLIFITEWERAKKAIENNQLMQILNFVQFYSQEIDRVDHKGYSLLALATHYGRVQMVQILLENGANPNVFTYAKYGKNTPLHLAVYFKFKKIQDLLLDAGSDEKALNAEGQMAWEGLM